MPDVANLVVRYSADTKDAEAGAERVNSSIGKVTKAGAALAIAGGALVGGFFAKSIMGAANFEQSMSGVAASLGGVGVAGGITTDQFTKLQDEALRIGQATSVGATDAARAMDLLAKSGVSVEDIYSGVAQGVVNVSEATGESLDNSAAAYGSFQAMFADTGISAAQMSDTIVNAMNASQMSLPEFQTGISRLSPVIAATGMSFQESAGALAYFNQMGFSAAETGTSLTAAFTSLVAPTTAQAAAQQAMGISAFDAQGAFVGFPAIMDQVAEATKGMTDQQKAETIATLFGADARDLMTKATEKGGKPLDDYIKLMNKSGTAATASATRMNNLKGDIEGLKGAFETLSIKVGSAMLPALRGLTQGLTEVIVGATAFGETFIKIMNPAADFQHWLESFPGWAQPVIKLFADLYQAAGDLVDAFQDFKDGDFAGGFRELREAADTALDGLIGFGQTVWDNVVGALSNVDWPGVWSTFTSGLVSLASAGIDLGSMAVNGILELGKGILNGASDLWGWFKKQIGAGTLVGDGTGGPEPGQTIPLGNVLVSGALKLWGDLKDAAGGLWNWVKGKLGVGGAVGGLSVPNPFGGTSGNKLDLGDIALNAKFQVTQLLAGAKSVIEGAITSIKGYISGHETDIMSALDKLFDWKPTGNIGQQLGERFGDWLNGLDWGKLFGKAVDIQNKLFVGLGAAILGGITLLSGVAGQIGAFVGGFIVGVFERIEWSRITSLIGDKFKEAFQGASDAVQQAVQTISDYLGRELSRAADGVGRVLGPVKTAFDDISRAAGNTKTLIVDFIDNGISKLSGVGSDVLSGLKSAFDDVSGAIDSLIAKYNTLAQFLHLPTIGGTNGMSVGGLSSGGLTGFGHQAGPPSRAPFDPLNPQPQPGGPQAVPNKALIPAPDTSQFSQGINTLKTITDTAVKAITPVFNTGIAPFVAAMKTQATSAVKQWAAPSGLGAMSPATERTSIGTIGAFSRSMEPISGAAGVAAGGAVTGFGGGIAPLPGNAGAAAGQAHSLFGAGLAPMPGTALGTAGQTAASLASGIAPMPGQAGATGSQVTGQFGSAIAPLPGQAGSTARNASGQFNSGISQVQQAVGIARGATSGIQGALAGASSGAYGYGYAIGAQFAAGLNASLSLVAGAAASLRNLLPSSPAKEGPLSKPVSWNYILDELEDTMGRMPGAARRGMSGTARELGRSGNLAYAARNGGYGPGGQVVNHYTINILKSEELQRIIKGSEGGNRYIKDSSPLSRLTTYGTVGTVRT